MEATEKEYKNCCHCESQIISSSSFCNICGKFQDHVNLSYLSERKRHLTHVGIFVVFELVICLLSYLIEDRNLFTDLGLDLVMVVSSLFFFVTLGNDGSKLLKWPNFSVAKVSALILITVISAYFVNNAVAWLNSNIFKVYELPYNLQYNDYKYGNYIMIFSIAIIPAIFEELAYRGYLMEKLLKIMGKEETIYLSSFLFFIMHFSIASIFWLLPFAIILAKQRLKENSLWPGIILHFFFNFTSCIVGMYGLDLSAIIHKL